MKASKLSQVSFAFICIQIMRNYLWLEWLLRFVELENQFRQAFFVRNFNISGNLPTPRDQIVYNSYHRHQVKTQFRHFAVKCGFNVNPLQHNLILTMNIHKYEYECTWAWCGSKHNISFILVNSSHLTSSSIKYKDVYCYALNV